MKPGFPDGTRFVDHPIYHRWQRIKQRCENPNTADAADYYQRGIRLCAGWQSFLNFITDMGMPTPGQQIDRIDNDGGYWCGKCDECKAHSRPKNCQWIDAKRQARNRRNSQLIEINGERKHLFDVAREHGLSPSVLDNRLRSGWPLERALAVPKRTYPQRKVG